MSTPMFLYFGFFCLFLFKKVLSSNLLPSHQFTLSDLLQIQAVSQAETSNLLTYNQLLLYIYAHSSAEFWEGFNEMYTNGWRVLAASQRLISSRLFMTGLTETDKNSIIGFLNAYLEVYDKQTKVLYSVNANNVIDALKGYDTIQNASRRFPSIGTLFSKFKKNAKLTKSQAFLKLNLLENAASLEILASLKLTVQMRNYIDNFLYRIPDYDSYEDTEIALESIKNDKESLAAYIYAQIHRVDDEYEDKIGRLLVAFELMAKLIRRKVWSVSLQIVWIQTEKYEEIERFLFARLVKDVVKEEFEAAKIVEILNLSGQEKVVLQSESVQEIERVYSDYLKIAEAEQSMMGLLLLKKMSHQELFGSPRWQRFTPAVNKINLNFD
jgi:hypothetical protein